MNKMLVVFFDTEAEAEAGRRALCKLHDDGDLTVYALAVIAKDAKGAIAVRELDERGAIGAPVGLAVGALVGLMGGPLALAVGAVAGTMAGAIRDFWMAGVDLDFIEEAEKSLQPGRSALVAEVDEGWVVPVDAALEACGGTVSRRARSEVVDAQFGHGIALFQGEIKELEAEAAGATGSVQAKLHGQVGAARARLARAVHHAAQRVEALGHEAEHKAAALKEQLSHAGGRARATLEARAERTRSGYRARAARLTHAWGLAKEAFIG